MLLSYFNDPFIYVGRRGGREGSVEGVFILLPFPLPPLPAVRTVMYVRNRLHAYVLHVPCVLTATTTTMYFIIINSKKVFQNMNVLSLGVAAVSHPSYRLTVAINIRIVYAGKVAIQDGQGASLDARTISFFFLSFF